MKTEEHKIKKRRADMPKAYRGIYDKAMSGQSRAAAIHSFCLECVGWQREEVRQCTAYACPLFPYRPYGGAQDPTDSGDFAPESTNAGKGYTGQGFPSDSI